MYKVNNRQQNDVNDIIIMSLLLTLNKFVSIVNFEHVIASRAGQ